MLVRLKLYLCKINWIKCTLFTLYFICNRENTTTAQPVFLHLSDIVTSHIPYPYRRKDHSDSPPTHLTYPDSLSWLWPSTVYKSGTPAIRGDPVGGNYHHYHADIIRTAIDLSDTSSYMNFAGDYSTAYYGLSLCIFLVSVWALRLALHIADHARGFLSVHIVYDFCPTRRSRFDGFIVRYQLIKIRYNYSLSYVYGGVLYVINLYMTVKSVILSANLCGRLFINIQRCTFNVDFYYYITNWQSIFYTKHKSS